MTGPRPCDRTFAVRASHEAIPPSMGKRAIATNEEWD